LVGYDKDVPARTVRVPANTVAGEVTTAQLDTAIATRIPTTAIDAPGGVATFESTTPTATMSKAGEALIDGLAAQWALNDGTLLFATTRSNAGTFTVRTSTGYARLINADGTLGAQAGTGAAGNNITLTIPAGGGLRALGILSVGNGGSTRSGNITFLDVNSRQIVAFSQGAMVGLTEVNCYNCPGLTSLPNWAGVTYVDCADCTGLTSLPNWASVTFVYCFNCPGLTSLPNWAGVTSVQCYNCPGLTSLPNWANVTFVYCSSNPGLTSLPNWAGVTSVYCYNCPGLTSLPNWANVTSVQCYNCTGLTSLPLWPSVAYVECYDNPGLTALPLWSNVTDVDCSSCTGLTSLPNWATVNYVYCPNCPGLTALPLWSNANLVDCFNCPGLTSLPNWTNVNEVSCSSNPGLTSLPNWANVTSVECYSCPGLTPAAMDTWYLGYAVTRPSYTYVDQSGTTGAPTAASAAVRADLVDNESWTIILP
jgi:hypothetical protein